MNTVFQVKNSFDHDIRVTSSIGLNATIEPGKALDINFPSDVHQVIEVDISPVQVVTPRSLAKRITVEASPPTENP